MKPLVMPITNATWPTFSLITLNKSAHFVFASICKEEVLNQILLCSLSESVNKNLCFCPMSHTILRTFGSNRIIYSVIFIYCFCYLLHPISLKASTFKIPLNRKYCCESNECTTIFGQHLN